MGKMKRAISIILAALSIVFSINPTAFAAALQKPTYIKRESNFVITTEEAEAMQYERDHILLFLYASIITGCRI